MLTKAIGWIILIFFVLVGFNYLFTIAGNFFAVNHLPYGYGGAALAQISGGAGGPGGSSTRGELSSVDFGIFDKGGPGLSYVTQGYGRTSFSYAYVNDWHNGIDIAATYGAPVYSPAAGTVIATGNQDNYCPSRGFGKFVAVRDDVNHLILFFAHLGTIAVAPGDEITKGARVGTIGTTGFETGTHLHFSIFEAAGFTMTPRNGCGPDPTGRDVNPLSYLGTVYK